MTTLLPSPLLRRALWADAAVSAAVAALQTAAAAPLAPWLGLPRPLLFESGVFLFGYALLVALMARSARLPAALAWLVVAGNLAWALAAGALAWELAPTALGLAFLAAHAATVLLFAALEGAGLQRSTLAAPVLRRA